MRSMLGRAVFTAALAAAAAAHAEEFSTHGSDRQGLGDPGPQTLAACCGLTSPRDPYARGVAALRAKEYRGASALLGAVVDVVPQRLEPWRLLGVAYAGQGRWHAARRAYERALRIAPNDPLSHAGRAEALLALNDARASEEAAWLRTRIEACAGVCAEAPLLRTLETKGPFANPAA